MSFFSRFFGKSAPADAKSSEMGIDAKTAQAILAEIDIDTAIAAHENWKLRLKNYVDGKSTETLQPEVICLDDRCDLGKWLHGPGGQRLGKYPAFALLVARHKYFHVQASSVVAFAQADEKAKANKVLGDTYEMASRQVVSLLQQFKQGLGR